MQVHHRLALNDDGLALMYIFDTCQHFIRTIPALVYDDVRVEDIDTDGEDHIYDELRYVCMANPIAPPVRKAREGAPYNPLDTDDSGYDRYDFYRKY